MKSINELENLRKELRKYYITGIVITLFISLLITIMYKNVANTTDEIDVIINTVGMFIGIAFLGYMITVLSAKEKRDQYATEFKTYFVVKALENYLVDTKYKPNKGISKDIISAIGMTTGDKFYSNDYICGNYKDVFFEQSDVEIKEETVNNNPDSRRTLYTTIFKGRWIIFEFNENFKANILLFQKWFNKLIYHNEHSNIKSESISFNKKFRIYTKNENEASLILTHTFINKIERLEEKIKGKILLYFIDNKLYIGLNSWKESGGHRNIFKKINNVKIENKITKEIQAIMQFVDELNADNGIFKM